MEVNKRVTLIKYISGNHEVRYEPYSPIDGRKDVSIVSYPTITSEKLNEIINATTSDVEKILSNI